MKKSKEEYVCNVLSTMLFSINYLELSWEEDNTDSGWVMPCVGGLKSLRGKVNINNGYS